MMENVVTSPLRYFQEIKKREPQWFSAALPVLAYVFTYSLNGGLLGWRAWEALPVASGKMFMVVFTALSAATGTVVLALFSVGGVVVIDLLAGGSRQQLVRKLIECSMVSYWTQVLWGLIVLCFMVVWYHPPAMSEAEQWTERIAVMNAESAKVAVDLIAVYFGLWLASLQACALRVVSGFSVAGAWAAAVVLGLAFAVLPWVVQRF